MYGKQRPWHPITDGIDGEQHPDRLYRLRYYLDWLTKQNRSWEHPDFQAYALYLLKTKSTATAAAYFSAVRARYRELLSDSSLLENLPEQKLTAIMSSIREALDQSHNLIQYARPAEVHHLSTAQIQAVLDGIPLITPQDLRDLLLIIFMLTFGLRESEICVLTVDAVQTQRGLSVAVPSVPGGKEREVRNEEHLFFNPPIVGTAHEAYVETLGLRADKALFRGFYKGGRRHRKQAISPDGVYRTLHRFEVPLEDDNHRPLTGYDLRRTFARRLYQSGRPFEKVHKALGYEDERTTRENIGLEDYDGHERFALADTDRILDCLEDNYPDSYRRKY